MTTSRTKGMASTMGAEPAGSEGGHDLAVLDLAYQAVGEDSLEPVAGQDAELAVLDRDQEDDAGVLALAPRLPGIRDAHGVGEVVERGGRRHGDHRDLGARLLPKLREERDEALARRARNDVRPVGDEALGRQDARLGGDGRHREREEAER